MAEPDGVVSPWQVAGADMLEPLPCVALTPRSVTVLEPSGVRVQLDADGCDGAVLPWVTASSLTVLEDGEPVEVGESGLEVRAMRPSLRVSLLVLVDLSGSIAASGSLDEVRTTVARLARDLAGAGAVDTGPWLEVAVYAFATRSAPLTAIVPFTSCPTTLKELDEPGALDPWRPSDPATDLYGSVVHRTPAAGARPTSTPAARSTACRAVRAGRSTGARRARPRGRAFRSLLGSSVPRGCHGLLGWPGWSLSATEGP